MLPTLLPSQNTIHDRKGQAVEPFRRQQVSNAGLECKDLLSAAEIQQSNHRDHSAPHLSQDLGQLIKAEIILTPHDLQEDKRSKLHTSVKSDV